MSAGPAGGGGRCPRVPAPPPPGVAGGGRGAARDAAPVPLTRASRRLQVLVQELEQYQVCASRRPPPRPLRAPARPCPGPLARPRRPPPPTPPPPAPDPDPRGGHACAARVFAVAAEEVGLGRQRAQQELRGIGETFAMSVPVFSSTWPPAPFSGLRLVGRSDPAALAGWWAGGRGVTGTVGLPREGFVLHWGGRVCFGRKWPWGAAGRRWGRLSAAVCGGVAPQVRLLTERAGGARARGRRRDSHSASCSHP